ncbi:ABC transporter substrate-binding protein [Clostridium fermenticellae]|uniref:ABC transporter substrate-binding protein n=1 Tax=Clostridium fermenticellae TaxID=2068654 RepID=UPI001FAB27AB|nr:ABC transporter substrate-binding protein [Clostridium fermenticellae]
MNHIKKLLIFILCIVFSFSINGCKNYDASKDEKKLNIYIDTKDVKTQNILKYIIDEYKKDNPEVKVTANNIIGDKIENQLGKSQDIDLICISRNDMINIVNKGLLNDIGGFYEENKINDKYYTVVNAYGRFKDKYYGIPIMPYTLEVLYNKDAINSFKLKAPDNIDNFKELLKSLNQMSLRIPVVLDDNIDINSTVLSIMVNNEISMKRIEDSYNNLEAYRNLPEMKTAFDNIQELVKQGVLNKNTFEIGNESSIKKFNKGDIPVLITSSYYTKELAKNNNISIMEYSGNALSKMSVPVSCNSILCMSVNTKNREQISKFAKFIVSDKLYKKLSNNGYVTSNKNVNKIFKYGINKNIVDQLSKSNENNIPYTYNIPEKLKLNISSKLEEVLEGRTSGDLWDEILNETYK